MKYLPTETGSTRGGVTGMKVSYRKGEVTEELPDGELDHCGFKTAKSAKNDVETKSSEEKDVTVAETDQVPTTDNTVDEIKSFLDDKGVEYTSRMTKKELLDLV